MGAYHSGKLREPTLRASAKGGLQTPPEETDFASVQGVAGQQKLPALFGGEAVFHQGKIERFVGAVELVAHDRMPNV